MKKLCMTEMLSPLQLERSRAIQREELVQFVHVVLENANKKEVFDVGDELMRLTNNIVSRMLMSTRCSEKGDEADRITKSLQKKGSGAAFLKRSHRAEKRGLSPIWP